MAERVLDRMRGAGGQFRCARHVHAVRDHPRAVAELADVGELQAELLDEHPQRPLDALPGGATAGAQHLDEGAITGRLGLHANPCRPPPVEPEAANPTATESRAARR
nr:hypothetical protein GCM10020092_034670 [Actinoplanes digitatis]